MTISVLGGGAFGSALAIALSQKQPVTLWARDVSGFANGYSPRLPGLPLPPALKVEAELEAAAEAATVLLAVPMQVLGSLLSMISSPLADHALVACCKGVDLTRLTGPSDVIRQTKPDAIPAVLTGPSFAGDIARGLPTALTLACADAARAATLQEHLSTPTLRLYRSLDPIGAELGGALKNVIAIACGASIGLGLGESARAALMTRGFAEMTRLAHALGAQPETLSGLSGFGDLALTCTSTQSRNFRFGVALGQNAPFDPDVTVEGAKTALAIDRLARQRGYDLPITRAVAAITDEGLPVRDAMQTLLTRSLKEEIPCSSP